MRDDQEQKAAHKTGEMHDCTDNKILKMEMTRLRQTVKEILLISE